MKNGLKSLLSLLLIAALSLSMAACGKSDDGSGDNGTEDENHPEFAYTAEYKKLATDQDASLYPRCYTQDGFYSTSYEKIGNNTPEGVTPEYEGQYDIYGHIPVFLSALTEQSKSWKTISAWMSPQMITTSRTSMPAAM